MATTVSNCCASTVSSITDLYRAAGYGQAKVVPHVTTSNGNLVISLAVQEGPRDIVDGSATARQHDRAAKSVGAERASTRAGQTLLSATAAAGPEPHHGPLSDARLPDGKFSSHGQAGRSRSAPTGRDLCNLRRAEGGNLQRHHRRTAKHTKPSLIGKTAASRADRPLSQETMLSAESRLYALGPFDWAEVNLRQPYYYAVSSRSRNQSARIQAQHHYHGFWL